MTDWAEHRKRQDRSRKASETAHRAIARMTPRDRLDLARGVLAGLIEDGFSYADFQGAQAVERHVKRASKELGGLS